MNKEFIPYPEAFALRELGFDERCFGRIYADGGTEQLSYPYTNGDRIGNVTSCSAPTYSQAFRWFREKYNLTWEHQFDDSNISLYVGEIAYPDNNLDFFKIIEVEYGRYNKAYEEAELACLRKLIEIVKTK